MARSRYPKDAGPVPEPLPPETRTVGQLVAETIQLYRRRFFWSLALGVAVGVLDELAFGHGIGVQTLILWACAPFLTLAYVGGSALAGGVRLTPRSLAVGLVVGILVFLPFPALFRIYVLPGFAWLALFGLAVPVAVIERAGFRASLARGFALARADYVHALGSLATLAIVYAVARLALLVLLHRQADAAQRVAGFLADVVLSPLLFLGAGLLYFDQAARYASPSASHSRRKPSNRRR